MGQGRIFKVLVQMLSHMLSQY